MSNLPTIKPTELGEALTAAKTRLARDSSSDPILKLEKTGGIWIYGADEIDVQDGSLWAINSHSLSEGFIAWADSTVQGEEMALMTGTPVIAADLPDVGAPWQKQVGFLLYCLNGDDKGTQVVYKSTAIGALKATGKIINAIIEQLDQDTVNIVPVVELKVDFYKHKKYGKIFTPVFEIKDWIDFSGIDPEEAKEGTKKAEEPEPEPEPKKKAATKKRRRAIAT